jgi:nitrite reductase/ring-hydroxylating ferredoxin subunit
MSDNADNWFAVSGSGDLAPGAARAVLVQDEDIVIWRSVEGTARAWQNRCIHRGMRLSHGQVRGEQLSCRYHGWRFDLDGQCTAMPATPDVKPAKTLRVPQYHCVERGGLIWVALESGDTAPLDSSFGSGPMSGNWIFGKSLYAAGAAKKLRAQLTGVRFPLFGRRETDIDIHYEVKDGGHNTLVVGATEKKGSTEKILIAIQEMSNARTALHLCFQSSEDEKTDQNKLRQFHDWAKRLRWFLQHPGAEYNGFNSLPDLDHQPGHVTKRQ